MRSVNKKLLFFAFILASVTTLLIYIYMNRSEKPQEQVEYTNVIVAARTLEKSTTITANDVKTVKINRLYINSRAATNSTDIVGKRAKERIIEGEQVLMDRIVNDKEMILSYAIPTGMRAVTINVNESVEVGDFIRPGDYVDILATFDKFEVEDSKSKTIYPRTTRVILQNILILGMGQLQDVPDKPRQELPKTVTLAVTLDDAEKLVMGEETGVLRMALRRVDEHEVKSTQGALREDMVTDRGKLVLPK